MQKVNQSIWVKISLIFLGFLLLVVGAVTATYLAVDRHASDALIIGIAGEQRELINSIALATYEIQLDSPTSVYYLHLVDLDDAASQFDETQSALLNGGEVNYRGTKENIQSSNTNSIQVQGQLDKLNSLWLPVREAVTQLLSGVEGDARSRAITEIETAAPTISLEVGALAQILEDYAARNLVILQVIQIVFLLGALGLLTVAYFFVKNNILQPLQMMNSAVYSIAKGNLSDRISIKQQDEFGALATAFEKMRTELALARKSSEQWTDRLEDRVLQRTKELEALLAISADISSNLDSDKVLKTVVDVGRELMEADVAVICLLDEEENQLDVASFSGPHTAIGKTQAEITPGLLEEVISRGKTVVNASCQGCPILEDNYLDDVIVAPLCTNERTIGAMCVADYEKENISEDSSRLLTLLSNSAAIAIENARLFDGAQAAAAFAEREQIAAEMHDGLAQTLGFLILKTDQALEAIAGNGNSHTRENLEDMQPAIQSAYKTVRQMLVGLSEDTLDQHGFAGQLDAWLIDFKKNWSGEMDLSLNKSCLDKLGKETQLQLLRITQESLRNVRNHAHADHVQISLHADGSRAVLIITDNGRGFDAFDEIDDGEAHLGLKIMAGRAEKVGGELLIESKPGEGTQINASVPSLQVEKRELVHR